jgi:hypothetical protein
MAASLAVLPSSFGGHMRTGDRSLRFHRSDARYVRIEEFWTICHRLWGADGPVDFEAKEGERA